MATRYFNNPAGQTRRREIYDILSKQEDIGALTDEELQQRLAMLQEFGTGKGKLIDEGKLSRGIAESAMLSGVNYGFDADKNVAGNVVANLAIQLGRYPEQHEVLSALSGAGLDFEKLRTDPKFANWVGNQEVFNSLTGNFAGGVYDQYGVEDTDIKSTQDLLEGRKDKSERETAVTDYLSTLPSDLESSRRDYLSGLTQGAAQQYQMRVPRLLENQNARGLLKSGDTGDLLATAATEAYAPVEQAQAQLENEDTAFYADMAYKNKVRQLLETSADWRTALDLERANVRSKQNQDFSSIQGEVNNQYQNQLLQSDSDRQLRAYKAKLDEASRANSGSGLSKLISLGAQAGGGLLGAWVSGGSPQGAQIGAYAGKEAADVGQGFT